MLKRSFRLRDRQSVSRVYRQGKTARSGALSVRSLNNGLDHSRVAIVVSKKVAKTAPSRNRLRRRLFETIRRLWPRLVPGHDMIISVFEEELKQTPQAKLDSQLQEVLGKSNLLN